MLLRLLLIAGLVVVPSVGGLAEALAAQTPDGPLWLVAKRKRKKRRRRRRRRKKRVRAVKKTPPKKVVKPTAPKVEVPAKPAPAVKPKAVPAASTGKPGIALKDLTSVHGVPAGIASLLNELMLTRLKGCGRFSSVIGGSDMAAMIDMEAQKQALGCDEDSCLAELGGALGVPYMLTAQLGKIGSRYMVTMKIISIEEAKVVVRVVETAKNEDVLMEVVDQVLSQSVESLLGKAKPSQPASSAPQEAAEPAEAEPPKVAQAAPGSRPGGWLKWSGVALGLGGAGWATYSAVRWTEQQKTFDERATWNSDELALLEDQADQANAALLQGLSAAGLGAALAWWGW